MKDTVIRSLVWCFAGAMTVASAPPLKQVESTIPFVLEQNFGSRPVVQAKVSGIRYKFMIHSNAGSPAQMNHRWAALAKVYNLHHVGAYGVTAPGKLSALGRDEGIISSLKLAQREYRRVRVAVFETPNLDDIGMLGVGWLHAEDVIMDFPARVLRLDVSNKSREVYDRRLRASGFSVIPMRYDPKIRRYLVDAMIGSTSRPMIVSTVAGLALDKAFAAEARVARGPVAAELEGPAGAVLQSYELAKPIVLNFGRWASAATTGQIQDVYAYQSVARPAKDAVGGMLGADFLTRHHAVIDFKVNRLYLRR